MSQPNIVKIFEGFQFDRNLFSHKSNQIDKFSLI